MARCACNATRVFGSSAGFFALLASGYLAGGRCLVEWFDGDRFALVHHFWGHPITQYDGGKRWACSHSRGIYRYHTGPTGSGDYCCLAFRFLYRRICRFWDTCGGLRSLVSRIGLPCESCCCVRHDDSMHSRFFWRRWHTDFGWGERRARWG